MTGVLQEIIGLLVSGISSMASGIGNGLQAIVTNLFLTGSGTTADPYALSTFGGVVVVFAAISLAVGFVRLITSWLTSLGGKRI